MIKLFSDLVNSAATGEKAPTRALQAWQFLVGKASNRQTVRYGDLAKLLGIQITDHYHLSLAVLCIFVSRTIFRH